MKRHIGVLVVGSALIAAPLFLNAACAGAQHHPDDLNSSEHRTEAGKLDAQADKAEEQYDPNAADLQPQAGLQDLGMPPSENPTEYNLRLAQRHRRHANQHRAAAEALERFEDAQCAAMATSDAEVCPLMFGVAEVRDIPGGVRLTVGEQSSVDQLFSQVRCHIAFGEAHGDRVVPLCALYVPGVRAAKSSAVAVELIVENPVLVKELRDRSSIYGKHDHVAGEH
jgi:hypothetical protein